MVKEVLVRVKVFVVVKEVLVAATSPLNYTKFSHQHLRTGTAGGRTFPLFEPFVTDIDFYGSANISCLPDTYIQDRWFNIWAVICYIVCLF